MISVITEHVIRSRSTNQETSRGQCTPQLRVPCGLARLSGKCLIKSDLLRSGVSHQEQEPVLEVGGEPGYVIDHDMKSNIDCLRFQATVNGIERGGDKGQWSMRPTTYLTVLASLVFPYEIVDSVRC